MSFSAPTAVSSYPPGAAPTISDFRVLPDGKLAYLGRIEVGRHPSALEVSGSRLYVALAGSDRVAIVDVLSRNVTGYFHDSAPGAPPEGSTPNALAISADRKRLFIAEADNNAVAVLSLADGKLLGRIPADWYPTAIAEVGSQILILSGKGHGTHANPDGPVPLTNWPNGKPLAYALGQLNGSLRLLPSKMTPAQLFGFTGAFRPQTTGSRAARCDAILRSSMSSTSSKRIVPTIRCSVT